jgi:AcrR family transcriptional regulator
LLDTRDLENFKRKPLRKRGEARVGAILDAATHVFLERGYEKATLAEIVARSGGSKSLVYEQFGGKAGLFRAMMEQRCAGMMEPLAAVAGSAGTPRDVLTAFARSFVAALSHVEVVGLQRIATAEGFRNPDVAETYFACGHDAAYTCLVAYLTGLATEPSDLSRFRRLVVVFFAMIQGDAVERLVVGAKPVPHSEIESYITLAVDWLLGKLSEPE